MKYVLNQEESEEKEEKDIEYSYFVYWLVAGFLLLTALGLVVMRFAWLNVGSAEQAATSSRTEVAGGTVQNTGDTAAQSTVEADTGLNLRVETREKTWLYVIFDGVRSREMMLRPGDTLTWAAEDTIRLRLGNAGGIQLYYRGDPLPLLGQSGEVTDKVITIDDGKLKVKTVGGRTEEVISNR
ncbi:MAG: DUF4115 domain-containing protein [bacterium]